MASGDGPEPSFFEVFLAEAAGPFITTVGGRDITVAVPSGDAVCELDYLTTVTDVLDALAGEDTADDILGLFEREPASALIEFVDDIRAHFGVLVPPRHGFTAVVELLDLYGEEIERDLITLGFDLYDWVRDHLELPWAKLLRILDRPVEGGWYEAARASDVELAEQIAELEAQGKLPKPPKRPPLAGHTRMIELLTQIADTMRRVEHAQWGASPKFKGKGGKPPKPSPRPLTARERVRRYRMYVEHDDIATQLLGSRYTRLTPATDEGSDLDD